MKRRVVGAATLGAIGLLAAVWSLWPGGSSTQVSDAAHRSAKEANQPDEQQEESRFEQVDQTNKLAGVVVRALDKLREALSEMPPEQQMPPDQQQLFVKDVGKLWSVYLGADYDGYVQYITSHDGRLPAPPPDQPPESMKEYWLSTVSGIAGKGVDPGGVRVLARWIQGREIEQESLATMSAKITSDKRFEIARDPKAGSLTVYEALLPVQFEWADTRGQVLFGVSLAWDAPNQRWLLWQLALYNTGGQAGFLVCPTY